MYNEALLAVVDDERDFIVSAATQTGPINRLVLIGSFTPRRCGIATFTADIHACLAAADPDLAVDVYALTSGPVDVGLDNAITATITETDPQSYVDAARRINASCPDIVWLQHEFGLFGGLAGDMVLELVDRIAAPLIVTLHTVLPDPEADQLRVMKRLITRASKLVVMAEHSARLLADFYGAKPDQIILIPHGVPDRPFGRSAHFKSVFGFAGRNVLMTFGLLSPGKGIETVIEALPAIVADHPDALYCIVGATHPNLLLREGEAYRERLHSLATTLGVESHICWIETFLETEELLDLIEAADIYITPYPGAGQSTSGTLSYAFALGKAVVSTPYVHATELLADNHGVLVPFGDQTAMAETINVLLDDPDRLEALQKRAYARGRSMIWPAFAERCLDLFAETRVEPVPESAIGPIGIKGLLRICDDIGIIQHSIYDVVDYNHGYCVDDNARALMLTNRLGVEAEPHRSRLSAIFARFVKQSWNEEVGNFRNFMSRDGNWLEEVGSEDSCGRALWAMGATAVEGRTPELRRWAHDMFLRTASVALEFGSPRATAFAMLGADYMLACDDSQSLARRIIDNGANQLSRLYRNIARPGWHWFEERLAYDNCRIPEAMIRAGQRLGEKGFTRCGIEALTWINTQQIAPSGHFRPVGSESFGRAYEQPRPFDQQAVDIWAAIEAAATAYDVTRDPSWIRQARRAYGWFGGANDRAVAVGDPRSGTCRDGITPRGLNMNEGAESVLAYQLATCAIRMLIAKAG